MKISMVLIGLILVVLLSGCTAKQAPITVLKQGFAEYSFSGDVREALNIGVNNTEQIAWNLNSPKKINVVFDGLSPNDNGYFQVTLFNMFSKLDTYWQSNNIDTPVKEKFYYLGNPDGDWFDATGNKTTRPNFDYPVLWLTGPNTGAKETSIKFEGGPIYLSGTSAKSLNMVGDRLALIAMGINSVDDINKKGFAVG